MLRELWYEGATRRYWWTSGLLMLGYVPAMVLAMSKPSAIQPPAVRALLALAPMPFLVGFLWIEFQRIRRTDELRQRVELMAGMAGLVTSVVLLMALGLLDRAGVVDIPLVMAAPVVCTAYVIAQVWAHRRYR